MQYRSKVACIFLLGFFIDCINIFMSAIAFPAMSTHFQLTQVEVAWIANSYILGLCLIIPMSTGLANILNTRRALLWSTGIFALSSFMAGSAESFTALLLWRFVQGLSGGLIIPVGQALTFNLYQGNDRVKISTLIMMTALIAPALSPMFGGWIVDISSWRWLFYSHIPMVILLLLLIFFWLKPQVLGSHRRPDYWGILLISLTLTSLLTSLTLLGQSQATLLIITAVLSTLLLAIAYIYYAKKNANPVVELKLLTNIRLKISIWIYLAVPGIFTGVNILSIFLLQDILHLTAAETGRFMLLYAIMAFVAMLLVRRYYQQFTAKKFFYAALIIHNLGILALAWVETNHAMLLLSIAYLAMGFGGGLAANTAQSTALLDFSEQLMPQASVIWNINRQISFSLGSALLLLLLYLLQQQFPLIAPLHIYHFIFMIAALIGSLPLLMLYQLKD